MKRLPVSGSSLAVSDIGDGPILLCVHGFPLDHSMWRGLSSELSDQCRVIAPDLRGFGANAAANCQVLTMEGFADDLNELLDGLSVTQPIVLCGLSMGGYIAWQFWRRYGKRLAGLVLCDTRAAADRSEVAKGRHYLAERVLREGAAGATREMVEKLFGAVSLDSRRSIVDETLQVMATTSPATIAAALRGMAGRVDATSWLAEIDCPALLICGEADGITPPEEMEQVADAMPNATFHLVPAVGHLAPLENPTSVNSAVRSFLTTLELS